MSAKRWGELRELGILLFDVSLLGAVIIAVVLGIKDFLALWGFIG